jgi:RNA polymerase sigma-70 factor (ECF subfamily)
VSSAPERRERFERVAAAVYEPLQRYLRRRAPTDDAADALADTLLVLWRRLDDVPDDALPWCYGAARRCLANQRRGDTRRLRLVQHAGAQVDSSAELLLDPQYATETSDPPLVAALAVLSESEAEIVRMWAWEQLEPREIAIALDMTANAASVALTRAKRKLAQHLGRQDQPLTGHIPRTASGGPDAGDREEASDD